MSRAKKKRIRAMRKKSRYRSLKRAFTPEEVTFYEVLAYEAIKAVLEKHE